MRRLSSVAIFIATAALALSACSGTPDPEKTSETENATGESSSATVLTVGASATPHAKILRFINDELAEAAGLQLEVKVFDDYVLPNTALDSDDLDANYFQTVPYLEKQTEDNGFEFTAGAGIHLEPLTIHSTKLKSIADFPAGGKIGIINDPTNQGRGLTLLAKEGLVELPASGDITVYTVKKLKDFEFQEVEGPGLVRALDEVDLGVINGNFAQEGGLESKDALAIESPENNPAVNILVWRTKNNDNPAIQKLEELLHSPEVKAYIEKEWPDGSVIPAF